MELGTKPVDASIDERKLYDLNKKYIEPKAHRFTYIENPIYLDVVFAKAIDAEKDGITYHLDEGTMRFIVSREEIAECKPNTIVRLRNAYNIRITNTDEFAASAEFVSTAKLEGKKMLRWILEQADLTVLMPDNLPKYGISDYAINKLKTGEYVYFDKFGYCIVEGKERNLNLVFTHP
jgi:hypothetical protein